MNYDTIDGSGFPLGFKVREGTQAATANGTTPARDVFRLEARTMGASGHQKEAVVVEGASGAAWRMVSDEGANLKGTDLAPFPLAFFNAGLLSDFVNRSLHMAREHKIGLQITRLNLDNFFYFSGSFFRGTGEGSADPVEVRASVTSSAPPKLVAQILHAALAASPAHAAMATPLRNTFALYVNGRRSAVTRVSSSSVANQTDPFMTNRTPPAPLPGFRPALEPMERLPADPADGTAVVSPGEGRVPIVIKGSTRMSHPDGMVATTVKSFSPGAQFQFVCDERPGGNEAPSGLACVAAGIAFCYMTQFTRYIEYRKHKVRAIRLIQTIPFTLSRNVSDGSLRGGVEPVDTHVFLHSEEPDEVMQNLLEVAENTCYLHAALRSVLPGRVSVECNGKLITEP